MIRETSQLYFDIVKPIYIDSMDMSHCNWMQSILNCEKETELRVFENQYFMLQKDWKYNEGDITTLYCLAIYKDPLSKIRTIRDLTDEHLSMLRSIRDESMAAIE